MLGVWSEDESMSAWCLFRSPGSFRLSVRVLIDEWCTMCHMYVKGAARLGPRRDGKMDGDHCVAKCSQTKFEIGSTINKYFFLVRFVKSL